MTTMTRDELAERIAELKREKWPRFGLGDVDGEGVASRALLSAAEDPDHRAIIQAYLRHFVPGECPCCGYGMFSWGVRHGSGRCSCGWPGTVYHYIEDDRDLPDLVCRATCNGYDVCGRPRGEHELVTETWWAVPEDGSDSYPVEREELRCPDPTSPPGLHYTPERPFTSRYHAPRIVSFQALLWAHPYEVHAR